MNALPPLKLPAKDRRELESRIRKTFLPQRDVIRARIILMLSDGLTSGDIARKRAVVVLSSTAGVKGMNRLASED